VNHKAPATHHHQTSPPPTTTKPRHHPPPPATHHQTAPPPPKPWAAEVKAKTIKIIRDNYKIQEIDGQVHKLVKEKLKGVILVEKLEIGKRDKKRGKLKILIKKNNS